MEFESKPNPWHVPNLEEFLYYCCPECDIKTKEHQEFYEHAIQVHELAKEALNLVVPVKVEVDPYDNEYQSDLTIDFGKLNSSNIETCNQVREALKDTLKRKSGSGDKTSTPVKKRCSIKCSTCLMFIHPDVLESHKKTCHVKTEDVQDDLDHDLEQCLDDNVKVEEDTKTFVANGKQVEGKQCPKCSILVHPRNIFRHMSTCGGRSKYYIENGKIIKGIIRPNIH